MEPGWSVGRRGLVSRLALLVLAVAGLVFLVLRAGAFGAPQPSFRDLGAPLYVLVHLGAIGMLLALQAIFILDVFANARLSDLRRVLWTLALVLGNVLAMPVYSVLHLRRARIAS